MIINEDCKGGVGGGRDALTAANKVICALTWTNFIVCMVSEFYLRDSFFTFWTRNKTAL
jgi:hypothetical protein